jgi:hypothetical protein
VAATAHYRHPPVQVHRQNRVHPDEDQPQRHSARKSEVGLLV